MKVLLVVPPGGHYAERWRHGVLVPPLGVAYLASVLAQARVEVQVLDAHLKNLSWRALRTEFLSRGPDLIGFSFATETRFEAFHSIKLARRVLPEVFLVAGGPHASPAAEDTLRHLPELDAVVRGEGEYTLVELVQKLGAGRNLSQVLGLSFRIGNEIVHNPDRQPISDLDTLPVLQWHHLDFPAYKFSVEVAGEGVLPAANLVTGRGCLTRCCFCSSSAMWGPQVRLMTPARVLQEIDNVVRRYGVRFIWFFDDVFTHDRGRVQEICRLMHCHFPRIRWFCEVRPADIDRDLLSTMHDSGCRRVGLGIESGSERVLDSLFRRKVNLGHARNILAWCEKLGITAHPFFILSLPGEEWQDARQTLEFIRGIPRCHEPGLGVARIYPGTSLERLARTNGIIPPDFSWTLNGHHVSLQVQGNVPVFLDRLDWSQIGDLLGEWMEIRRGLNIRETFRLVGQVRSWRDLRCGARAGLSFLRRRVARFARARE